MGAGGDSTRNQKPLHPETATADISGMNPFTSKPIRIGLSLVLAASLAGGPRWAWALEAPEPAPARAGRDDAARATTAQKLKRAGLTPAEAAARASAMTDAEAAHVADDSTEVRKGGSAILAVLTIVAIVAVVYMVYDYTTHRPAY